MSRLPQLEAQLVAAAGAPPRRSLVPRRALAGLAVAAAAAGVALAVVPRRETPVAAPRPAASVVPATVPAATIERSHAMTTETRAADAVLTPDQVPGVAAGFEASTPHPPGVTDGYDWAHPKSPIARAADIQSLVEYRSYCMWLRYWVDGPDRAGAAQVLADFPRWPTQRTTDPYEGKLLNEKEDAISGGDVGAVQRELAMNCRGI
jgi:hypothetical protein